MRCDKVRNMLTKWGYNKRLAVALVLAGTLLLGFCWGMEQYMERESRAMLADVLPLAQSVAAKDWATAEDELGKVLTHWQSMRRVWLGLLSHREVWNIDEALLGISVMVEEERHEEAREQLALVQYYLERAYLSDRVNWSNFF